MRVPQRMDAALFQELVDEFLRAHRYKIKTTQDAYQLYPGSSSSGDIVSLTTGVLYDPYEVVPYLTTELIGDEDGFRADGQTFKIQGLCAVLVHSHVESRPDPDLISELASALDKQGIKHLLVFVNHFMFFNEGLTGVRPYNCFPEFSAGTGGSEVFALVQHLEDLGRKILLAANIYMAYRACIPWVDETVNQKLKSGEIRIITPEELGY